MLQIIRGSLNSFLVLVLMGLLIAVFALWGVGDIFRNPGAQSVATVNGKDVPMNEFVSRFQNLVQQQQQTNPDFNSSQAFQLGMHQAVISQIVRDEIIAQAALDLGLTASNKQISRIIADEESFQIADQFDVTRYNDFLRRNNLNETKLFDDLRANQARVDLMNGIANAVFTPDYLVSMQLKFLKEKRTGTVVTLPISNYLVTETPSDEVLKPFFEERSSRYLVPEYRSFKYVALTAEQVAEDITVSDEELAAEYEARSDLYNTPEQRAVDQIVFPTEEEARAIFDRVNGGEDFVALASELAGYSEADMDLGALDRSQLEEQYQSAAADAVFALTGVGITEPVETAFGFAVYRVREIMPATSRTLEDVKGELRELVAKDRALGNLFDLSQRLDDQFATGANLEEAAASLGLEVKTVNGIAKDGSTKDGSRLENAVRVNQMLENVFILDLGNVLETAPLGEDGYFAIEMLNIDPERPMTFEEARDLITAEWRRVETEKRAHQAAQDMADKAESSVALAGLASAQGLDVIQDISYERLQIQQAGAQGSTAAQLMFSMDQGEADIAQTIGGTSYIIAYLSKIEEADVSTETPEFEAVKLQLTQLLQNDVQGQYLTALQEENDIRINQKAINTYREQLSSPANPF
ncbi:MAG: SurA N-terminal domain-containing protein [Sphingomonadales bacterium]|jgi:peptidyl-prolyl cis-trans isomerase D